MIFWTWQCNNMFSIHEADCSKSMVHKKKILAQLSTRLATVGFLAGKNLGLCGVADQRLIFYFNTCRNLLIKTLEHHQGNLYPLGRRWVFWWSGVTLFHLLWPSLPKRNLTHEIWTFCSFFNSPLQLSSLEKIKQCPGCSLRSKLSLEPIALKFLSWMKHAWTTELMCSSNDRSSSNFIPKLLTTSIASIDLPSAIKEMTN